MTEEEEMNSKEEGQADEKYPDTNIDERLLVRL